MGNTFIVIDGIDGCGKGEQIKMLHNYLFDKNKRNVILTTREPTYGVYGVKIRKILKEDEDPYEKAEHLLGLYTKDRNEHLESIVIPFLKNENGDIKKFVLCDRYYYSTYAFQQTQGIPFDEIHKLQMNFLKPDVTFILDVDSEVALSRIDKSRNIVEKFEKLEFMRKVRQNFIDLKSKLNENIIIIDASKSKKEVFDDIISHLKKMNLI